MRLGLAKLWLTLTLAGCAASANGSTQAIEQPAPLASSARAVASADLSDIAMECTSADRAARCTNAKGATELGSEIEAAQKAVLDSGYADVHALVRLVKLQLRRDEDISSPDGSSDAARALRNAMRAVAVDDSSVEARLVLSLALARSLHQATTTADPLVRGLALDLVGLSLHDVRYQESAARAVGGVLEKTIDRLRAPSGEVSHLGPESLAPTPPPLPRCSLREAADATTAPYCKGLDALSVASSRADNEQAAAMVIDGWRTLTALCEAQDPACPPHIFVGLVAASRAFLSAGRTAKSIAADMLIASHARLPNAAALEATVSLELGDRYYSLGVFDQAADWYERAAKRVQADPTAPANRALQIRVALGDAVAATRLAADLMRDQRHPQATKADWAVMVAHVVRTARGPASDPSEAGCEPLTCAVRRLANEPW